ncbi:hypothetical protein N9A78_00225 [Akkermansiaceae bacterium]|nr:hypothetical protein [Akkermansiaceae bacterium]
MSTTGAKRDDFIGEHGGAHRGEMAAGGEAHDADFSFGGMGEGLRPCSLVPISVS